MQNTAVHSGNSYICMCVCVLTSMINDRGREERRRTKTIAISHFIFFTLPPPRTLSVLSLSPISLFFPTVLSITTLSDAFLVANGNEVDTPSILSL